MLTSYQKLICLFTVSKKPVLLKKKEEKKEEKKKEEVSFVQCLETSLFCSLFRNKLVLFIKNIHLKDR